MRISRLLALGLLTATAAVGGCADGGGLGLTTATVTPEKTEVAAKPAYNPACVELAARIDSLSQDGTVGRVASAATGKTKTVVLKRTALVKVGELNAATAEFRAKCSTIPAQAAAPAASPAAAPVATPVAAVAQPVAASAAATTVATVAAKAR